MFDHDAQMEREYQRQQAVEEAKRAADQILDASRAPSYYLACCTAETILRAVKDFYDTKLIPAKNTSYWSREHPRVVCVVDAVFAILAIVNEFPEDHSAVRRHLLLEVALKYIDHIRCFVNSDLPRYEMDNPAQAQS